MKQWKSKANWKDPNWVYVNAASTNVAETIARVKKEMEALDATKIAKNVTDIKARKVK